MLKQSFILFLLTIISISGISQENIFEGYVFDSEHEDRLKDVNIDIFQNEKNIVGAFKTDYDGKFKVVLPNAGKYKAVFSRQAYQEKSVIVDISNGSKSNNAISLTHLPGFEFTGMIQEYMADGSRGAGIKNTQIEVYNKNTKKQELTIFDQPDPNFVYHFEKKNRYVVQVKKAGYYTKRLEATIDQDGCTICLEGIDADNLSGIFDNDKAKEPLSSSITGRITLRKINLNEIIEIENIYYKYDKSNIKDSAKPALNNLVNVMRTTPIIIELSSHTDSRGDNEYNQKLSQERAQSAVDYIVSRGIDRDRLTASGYGESKLINECGDDVKCTEAEHQKNRRTEFKVVRLMEEGFDGDKSLKEIVESEVSKK